MTDTDSRPAAPDAPAAAAPRATRHAYRDALPGLMLADERIVCLDTDTGLFSGTDFGAAADRYVNIGIAEQNLMGMAAGLAAGGRIPFVNTMAAFASARALEAVKIDIAYNRLPVRIAATHGGLSAGHLGPTHHCLEDLAAMRALPGMTVTVPADADQAAELTRQGAGLPGPLYLRLGRKATPPLPAGGDTRLGLIQMLRPGQDAVIVACGPHPVLAALDAAAELGAQGIDAAVLNAHTLKPFDDATLTAAARDASVVVTVEEHWAVGGLGGAVSEVLAQVTPRAAVVRLGVPDTFVGVAGDHEDLLARVGLTGAGVAEAVRESLAPGRKEGRR